MNLKSGVWWGAKLELGELGSLRCNQSEVNEDVWLWQYTPFRKTAPATESEHGRATETVALQGMRKSERGAKRNALIEVQRYLGGKLKLLGKVKP